MEGNVKDFLWSIIPWGYQVLLDLEGMRTGSLNLVFSIITDMGSEIAYIVILSLLYWCVNKSVGQRLVYANLLTLTINAWIKDLWRIPRPDDPALEDTLSQAGIARRLDPLRHATDPAFVSGHTQGAAVTWGYMAARFKKTWFRVVAGLLVILIGFSRIYLGVHFPQDVIGGLIVGLAYLLLWVTVEPYARAWLSERGPGWRYALAVLVPLVMFLLYPVKSTATPIGAVIGLGVGFVLEGQNLRFIVAGAWWRRVLRGVVGLIAVLIAYVGLSALFGLFDESIGAWMEIVWRVIRYTLVGFVGGWVAPWLFTSIGLAESER
jgi:membrane-associated phospholipid phosphatase